MPRLAYAEPLADRNRNVRLVDELAGKIANHVHNE
jgi:hypothetical protein